MNVSCHYSSGGGKDLTISILRLMAMSMIIVCHFCQYYDNEWAWWLNVGVQIFFIISGYLYGKKKIQEPISWLKRQYVKILIPYWTCLTITLIGYYFVSPELLTAKSVIGAYLTSSTIKGIGHLWFISYILFCYLITPYLSFLRDYLSRYSISVIVVTLMAMLGLYSIASVMMNAHFRPGLICCYIVGYSIAALQNRTKKNIVRRSFYIVLLPCILLNVIYCYFRYCKNIDMHYGTMAHLTDYSHLLLGLAITLFFMTVIRNTKYYKILKFSDNNSYEVYLIHQIFILGPFTLLGITEFPFINVVFTFCVILFAGSMMHFIAGKVRNI